MHPSPGHCSGTMVNALLHHCGISEGIPIADGLEGLDPSVGGSLLPMFPVGKRFNAREEDDEDDEDADAASPVVATPRAAGTRNIRPGIVHRLDKGNHGSRGGGQDGYRPPIPQQTIQRQDHRQNLPLHHTGRPQTSQGPHRPPTSAEIFATARKWPALNTHAPEESRPPATTRSSRRWACPSVPSSPGNWRQGARTRSACMLNT